MLASRVETNSNRASLRKGQHCDKPPTSSHKTCFFIIGNFCLHLVLLRWSATIHFSKNRCSKLFFLLSPSSHKTLFLPSDLLTKDPIPITTMTFHNHNMNHKDVSRSSTARNGGGNNYGVSELLRLAATESPANSIYGNPYLPSSSRLPPLPYSMLSSSPSPSDPDYLISILETVLDIVNQDLIETEDDKSNPSLQEDDEDDDMPDQ